MAAVVEMDNMQPKECSVQETLQHQGSGDYIDGQDGGNVENLATKKNEKLEKHSEGVDEPDSEQPIKEVKIDIEKTPVPAGPTMSKKVSLPPISEDFSEEKDAPEVSTRVYDFNMVKQKTLPRINFGSTGVFQALSSHSKTYIIAWTLMPLSLVICIIVLIVYFLL